METVNSQDGTSIAFDRFGDGPPVVLVCGGSVDRMSNAPLAPLLAERFTVSTTTGAGAATAATRFRTPWSARSRTSTP